MEFKVTILNGDVYINGEFVSQLCWDSDAIGNAIAQWINEQDDFDENDDFDEEDMEGR